MSRWVKNWLKGALIVYVIAVLIDHLMLKISWGHALTDPHTLAGAAIVGLLISWIAGRKN